MQCTTSPPCRTDLRPSQYIEHYQVETALPQRDWAELYLAQDTRENREVVLKFPHEMIRTDPVVYEHFQRELKIGQRLAHPNIQKLYSLEGIDALPFIVMQYIPGRSLADVLHEEQAQSLETGCLIKICLQIATALAYAHDRQVVHRNLIPDNILVTPDGQAVLVDFGIALLQGARRVTWGAFSAPLGTPGYMAPEQIQGARGDSRTDIYALGMILYECVAGCLPYEGDDVFTVMAQHVNVAPPPIHCFRKNVDPALEEIILKAIRRKPEDRWPTMQSLIGALENPACVDVETLRAEREREPKYNSLARTHIGILGLCFWQAVCVPIIVVLCLVFVGVIAQWLHGMGR